EWTGIVQVSPPVQDLTGEVAIVSDQVAVLVDRFEHLRLWVNPIRSRNRVVLTRFTGSTRIVVINIDNKVVDRVVRPFTVHPNLTHKAEGHAELHSVPTVKPTVKCSHAVAALTVS